MAMKPIKLKDLLTQTKKPVTQQIEIMEDYVLSVKTVFEGAVKDVPEDIFWQCWRITFTAFALLRKASESV